MNYSPYATRKQTALVTAFCVAVTFPIGIKAGYWLLVRRDSKRYSATAASIQLGMVGTALGILKVGPEVEIKLPTTPQAGHLLEVLRKNGFSIEPITLDDITISNNEVCFFRRNNGYSAIIIGVYREGDECYYQIIEDMNGPVLVNVKNGFYWGSETHALKVRDLRVGRMISVSIGGQEAEIVDAFRNFGVARPFEKAKATLSIRNRSDRNLIFSRPPTSSCGCTVGKIDIGQPIRPGEVGKIYVEIETGRTPFHQTIDVGLSDEDRSHSEEVRMNLIGSMVQSMDVSPESVDFGPINDGESARREVRLSEVPEDHFKVLEVDFDGMRCSYMIKEHQNKITNRLSYQITLSLNGRDLKSRENAGVARIHTTSRRRPVVEIGMHATLKRDVQLLPPSLFFGTIARGKRLSKEVCAVVENSKIVEFALVDHPPNVNVRKSGTADRPGFLIELDQQTPGDASGTIHFRLKTTRAVSDLTLNYSGYVTD